MIRKVAVIFGAHKEECEKLFPRIAAIADRYGVTLYRDSSQAVDLILSLGGDGSMIRAFHANSHLKAPIIGINLGNLGFLAEIPLPQIERHLEALFQGDYFLEKRLMLCCQKNHAINDIVLHRAENQGLIEIEVHVDGKLLHYFRADGIIIATPTGSTAYSLAAGGPILSPRLFAAIVSPICPHTISYRPVVIDIESNITLKLLSGKSATLSIDGITHPSISEGDTLEITYAKEPFLLLHTKSYDFYTLLRSKLGWSGGKIGY